MIEIGALFLTIGAVFYHILHLSLTQIFFIAFAIFLITSLFFYSKKGILFALISAILISIGALSVWRVDFPVSKDIIGQRRFEAKIISVDRRLEQTYLVAKVQNHKIQISVPANNDLLPGDQVKVFGDVSTPEDFLTDNGRIFEYSNYLSSKGIDFVMNNPDLQKINTGKSSLSRIAAVIRYKVSEIFSKYIVFPVDGILAGMTVGYQGGIPKSTQEIFRNTGVLHVLVLSGYNITLLAGFLAILFQRLAHKTRLILTIIAIILLVLVSGAGVASVRAAIMGTIALTAGITIRKYNPLRALTLAYIFFLLFSPKIIFIDPGLHLSFLATLFIVIIFSKINNFFTFIPEINNINIREIIVLALFVPIFMLPYMMYFNGIFPLSASLANIILSFSTPVMMIAGILVILFSLFPPAAFVIGAIVSSLGIVLIEVLSWLSKLPIWNTPLISGNVVSLIYIAVILLLFYREIKNQIAYLFKALS